MKKLNMGGWVLAMVGVLVGCSGAVDEGDERVSLEDATYLSALETNEDGSDEDAADTTNDGPRLFRGCGVKALRQSLIDRFDADGDGALSEEEKDALSEEFGGKPRRVMKFWHHSRLRRLVLFKWIYDADGSGDLSEAERAELEADLEARCEAKKARMLEEFDTDGDGELSEDEWIAVHDAIKARWADKRAKLLEEYDTNGDGKLDHDERQAAREAIRDRIQEHREELKAKFDGNGDGKLDEAERAALIEYLREKVRGEHLEDNG